MYVIVIYNDKYTSLCTLLDYEYLWNSVVWKKAYIKSVFSAFNNYPYRK